jgi:phosphatidylglycerophosphatase A
MVENMGYFSRLRLPASNKPIPPIPKAVWKNPLYFIAFGFGSGASPVAPGTAGTLAAIPIYLLLQNFSLPIYLILISLFTIGSIFLCEKISKETGTEDHPGMCIDEFIGFFVTMINAAPGIGWIILGFILFRIFDIWKPWPIRLVDKKIHGGLGMILDDVLAGFFALIIMQLAMYWGS